MKQVLSVALGLVCVGLVMALFMSTRAGNSQRETDAATITEFSNRLDTVKSQLPIYEGRILVFSNHLSESQAALLTSSNELVKAQFAIARHAEQITNLTRQLAGAESENQTLNRRITELASQMTNQVENLTQQLDAAKAALNQANKDYALLENRFRIDVGERLVIQRKFQNLTELQTQIQRLKEDPFVPQLSAQDIYAGLDVEVTSNRVHVISQN
jgi:chromosome segregation ATPase